MLNSNMTIEVAGAEVNASRRNWRQHPYDDPVVITSARLPPTKIWGDSTASIPGQDRPDLAKNSCTLLPSHLEMLPADLHGSDTYIAMRLSWSTTTYASMTLRIRHPRPIGLS
jgi:hypothetical protein